MKKLISGLLCGMMIAITACSGGTKAGSSLTGADGNAVVEIKIPTYRTGQNIGGKFFVPQVERFNQAYEGKYKITLEEVPEDSYTDKIKQLAQQKKLPPIVEGGKDAEWLQKVVIDNNLFYDLSDWLDRKPELKASMIPDSIEYNTQPDGQLVSLPFIRISIVGLYYNNSMIQPEKPIGQMTYNEFETMLGKEKIAFMTSENAWTANLFITSLLAQTPEGVELLKSNAMKASDRLSDFNQPVMIDALTQLQNYLQTHASANTLGAAYADAANSFMSKNAAVIPNGTWMVGEFDEESMDKWSNGFNGDQVSLDIYPGNVAIGNPYGYFWWIPAGLPEAETEAALAFLEFISTPAETEAWMLAEGGVAPYLTMSEDYQQKLSETRLLSELTKALNEETVIVPAFTDSINNNIANIEWGKLLPKLIDGSWTPEQYAQELTNKAIE